MEFRDRWKLRDGDGISSVIYVVIVQLNDTKDICDRAVIATQEKGKVAGRESCGTCNLCNVTLLYYLYTSCALSALHPVYMLLHS